MADKEKHNYATLTTKHHLAGWKIQDSTSAGARRLW